MVIWSSFKYNEEGIITFWFFVYGYNLYLQKMIKTSK